MFVVKHLWGLCLVICIFAVGCGAPPSGNAGDENDPLTTSDTEAIDPALEAEANEAANQY